MLYNTLAKIFFGYTIKGGKNKMSKKKVLSVVLAASMVASAAVTTAVTTAADDDIRGTVYFDSTGPLQGAQRNTYYCYMWASDGSGQIAAWNTAPLKMKKVEGQENLFSFNVPRKNSDGATVNADLVIFSGLGKGQTYDTTFSDSCFGDTAYVLDEVLENPVDSAQTALACAWRNNPQEGAHISITSTGRVQGVGILSTETPESITDAFIQQYNDGMAQGKVGYDNPDLVTDAARQSYIDQINAIISSQPERPTEGPTTEAPTEAPTEVTTQAPTQAPTEAPTQAQPSDTHGRKAGLPLPADMNLPSKNTSPDDVYSGWDGYYNVYYFEAPEEWLTQHADAKEKDANGEAWEIGFYWFTGGTNNGDWPGEKAGKIQVNGKTYYYGFAPTFAGSIIWNNGISDRVAENKQFKLQTEDIKVDDPALNSLADIVYEESDGAIDGVSAAGCLAYVSSVEQVVNGLTGDTQDVYKCKWKFFDPQTGATTETALKNADGSYVTVSGDAYGYGLLAVNPYYDMDYTHVNEGVEIPTDKPVSTLPPAGNPTTAGGKGGTTNATGAAGTTNGNNSGKTVNTAEGAAVVVLGTVLFAAMGVAFVARKRRESEEA